MTQSDWLGVAFFAFNAAFTAFNARIAWMNWKREERQHHPVLDLDLIYGGGEVVVLSMVYRSNGGVSWRPVRVLLERPRAGTIANPLQYQKMNRDNEPWVPSPIEVDWASTGRNARLFVHAVPGREEVWLKFARGKWPKALSLIIEFQSQEPQPRVYRMKVSRVIPAFATSIVG